MKPILLLYLFLFMSSLTMAQDFGVIEQKYQNSYKRGDIDSAEIYAQQALKAAEKNYTQKSKAYASALGYMAAVYRAKGMFDQAEKFYLQSMVLKKEMYGETHANYANALNNLANLYLDKGDFNKSEPLLLEALRIYKISVGENNAFYANTLFNLGNCYFYQGNYSQAQIQYQESMNIKKNVLGKNHPEYANSLNNLAVLYAKIGNYDKVEKLLLEALQIKEETVGPKSNEYAMILTNIASLYMDQKKYDIADSLYQRALIIQKNTVGQNHPDYITTLNSVAVLYNNLEDYVSAKAIYEEVLALRKNIYGTSHPAYANTLSYLAYLYLSTGDYVNAEQKLIEAYTIRKEVLGINHPDFATTILSLATFYHELEEDDKAEPYYIENSRIRINQLMNNFAFLSEKEKEKFWASLNNDFFIFNSFAVDRYKTNPKITEMMYNNQLATKGILFNSSVQIRNKILNSKDSALITDLDKWLLLKESIGKMYQFKVENTGPNKIDLPSLERAANQIEKLLSDRSEVFAKERASNLINWKHVQMNLSLNEAAIEFLVFPYFRGQKFTDERTYYALIIKKEYTSPVLVRLCKEQELDEALADDMAEGINNYVISDKARKKLYNLVWYPIDSLLGGDITVQLSLTGLLHKISFGCLSDKKNNLMLNKYDIHYINSTRDIALKKQTTGFKPKNIVCFGGINYDLDEETVKSKTNFYNNNSINQLNTVDAVKSFENTYLTRYPMLDGTLNEVNSIKDIFQNSGWKATVFQGSDGSEENIKNLKGANSPTVLHLATHGFFFPFPKDSIMARNDLGNFFLNSLNPLYRSGVILAGANYIWLGGQPIVGIEDGVLTAYEVSNLNLQNTELVVLSACQTGLGEIRSGEGVYGLQRSFQEAGAKSLIMSLWDIPDKETVELMQLFYTYWMATSNKHGSFIRAQKELAAKYKEPFFWAGFVMIE